jgi:hypothetical protein
MIGRTWQQLQEGNMKTEEDEAFDDLARKQGDWGGGFQAKRQMAADRFKDGIQWWMDTKTYGACPNPPQWHIDTGNLVRLVPQREWVDLSDSQIERVYHDVAKLHRGAAMPWGQIQFGRALQALIKEKNT